MIKFFHRLFNPHCSFCHSDDTYKNTCKSCEVLQHQLEVVNFEKKQLLDSILVKPVEPIQIEPDLEKVKSKFIPWKVRQQMLEEEDRVKARILRKQSIDELEEQLKIKEGEVENAS